MTTPTLRSLLIAIIATGLLIGPVHADETLVGAGDIAVCSPASENTAALLDTIPGTVFTAGDVTNLDGTQSDYESCYEPTWGRHKNRTLFVPGNHDWHEDDLSEFIAYTGNTEPWRAVNLGHWRIYLLDSDCEYVGGCDYNSPQGQWLRADLKANPRTCSLAIWHHPRWTSMTALQQEDGWRTGSLFAALDAYGVDVLITGHAHMYERFARLDATGATNVNGVRQFIVGTGGAHPHNMSITPRPGSLVRQTNVFGVLKMTLREYSYTWEFIDTEGTFTDAASTSCA